MRAQLAVFSAALRPHQRWCIGGGHSEGPLRVRPRFGMHSFPGIFKSRRRLEAQGEEGPVLADRLTEPFTGTDAGL